MELKFDISHIFEAGNPKIKVPKHENELLALILALRQTEATQCQKLGSQKSKSEIMPQSVAFVALSFDGATKCGTK